MAHSFPSDTGVGHFHTTFIADHSLVFHPFIFAAKAFPIIHRPEYLGTKQAIFLRTECPIINSFRLFNLAIRPADDFFRRRNPQSDAVKICGQTTSFFSKKSLTQIYTLLCKEAIIHLEI